MIGIREVQPGGVPILLSRHGCECSSRRPETAGFRFRQFRKRSAHASSLASSWLPGMAKNNAMSIRPEAVTDRTSVVDRVSDLRLGVGMKRYQRLPRGDRVAQAGHEDGGPPQVNPVRRRTSRSERSCGCRSQLRSRRGRW